MENNNKQAIYNISTIESIIASLNNVTIKGLDNASIILNAVNILQKPADIRETPTEAEAETTEAE